MPAGRDDERYGEVASSSTQTTDNAPGLVKGGVTTHTDTVQGQGM